MGIEQRGDDSDRRETAAVRAGEAYKTFFRKEKGTYYGKRNF
jgi:hypothetical protein